MRESKGGIGHRDIGTMTHFEIFNYQSEISDRIDIENKLINKGVK